jgi:hypothetical protein
MTKRKRGPIVVGDETFASKEAIRLRVQELLRRGYRVIDGPEEEKFLLALFARHPSAAEKIGVGISRIRVVRVLPFGTSGFEIERLDGTRTDISYKECLTPSKPAFWFSQSCRSAVVDQIQDAKQQAFLGAAELSCPVTGERITWDSCQVHHEEPWEFEKIVASFIADRSIDPSAIEYDGGDGVTVSRFVDDSLSRDFAEFHRARASLRVVSRIANESILRRGKSGPQ